jgi:queuine tRNA-ribosyltransferase
MENMSYKHFKELERNGYRRSGLLTTRRGVIHTPAFMPVGTRGAVKHLEPEEVKQTGAEIILGNTYHLHLQPGEELIERIGGLHSFTGWSGPILTDSGGFQVFSLAHIRKISEEGVTFKDPKTGDMVFISPEKSIQIQLALGSDIIMAFDDLTGLDDKSKGRTTDAVERTHRWLGRSIAEFKRQTNLIPDNKRPLLFGIAQGGLDQKLRSKSLEFVQSQAVDGIAIGGLSVGETRAEMHDMLEFLAPLYDFSRPHYLMGVGDPIDMRFSYKHGIDMVDCVMATRNARHGSVWITGDKRLNLKNADLADDSGTIDQGCDCHTCSSGYSRAFIRHQFKVGEPLAARLATIHNLHYMQRICREYQNKAP